MNKQNIVCLSHSLLKAKIAIETYRIKHQCLFPLESIFFLKTFKVVFSGLRQIMWHSGAKMQPRSPALEANMDRISHGHHNLALGARQGEERPRHCMKVRNLASLKVSGKFLARKAKEKVRELRNPGIPGQSRNPNDQIFLAHDYERLGLRASVYLKERVQGSSPDSAENHPDQEHKGDDIVRSSSNRLVLPGFLALNARTTVRFWPNQGQQPQ